MPGVLRASFGDDEPHRANLLTVVVGAEPTLRRGCTPRKSHIGNIRMGYALACTGPKIWGLLLDDLVGLVFGERSGVPAHRGSHRLRPAQGAVDAEDEG
jgi:hypothetical protein